MEFDIYEFFAELNRRRVPIRLDAGQPDLPPHPEILETLRKEIHQLGYASPRGIDELRERIAEIHGVEPREVVVSPGSKAAIAAMIHASRQLGLVSPSWPGYKVAADLFGRRVSLTEASPEENWLPSFAELNRNIDTLIVNYPHNPTGAVLTREKLKELINLAEDRGLILVSDEAYRDYTYRGEELVMIDHRFEKTISIYSFSKTFSLPGLRIAYAVGDPELVNHVYRFVKAAFTSVPVFAQKAALKALELRDEIARRIKTVFLERLKVFRENLDPRVFDYVEPRGTFYVFVRVKTGLKGSQLAWKLAEKGVGVFPGEAFGDKYSNYIRVSLTRPAGEIALAARVMNEVAMQ